MTRRWDCTGRQEEQRMRSAWDRQRARPRVLRSGTLRHTFLLTAYGHGEILCYSRCHCPRFESCLHHWGPPHRSSYYSTPSASDESDRRSPTLTTRSQRLHPQNRQSLRAVMYHPHRLRLTPTGLKRRTPNHSKQQPKATTAQKPPWASIPYTWYHFTTENHCNNLTLVVMRIERTNRASTALGSKVRRMNHEGKESRWKR